MRKEQKKKIENIYKKIKHKKKIIKTNQNQIENKYEYR